MINKIKSDDVLIIEFDNKVNAFNRIMINDLLKIFNDSVEDDSIKSILITGKGKFFSAGTDLKEILNFDSIDQLMDHFITLDELFIKMFSFPKPLIAAVNGHSMGCGIIFQLCADYIISTPSSEAKFALPEVNLGMTITKIMKEILSFSLNNKVLSEILFTAGILKTETALQYNLINQTSQTEESLLKDALSVCEKYNRLDNKSLYTTKKYLRENTIKIIRNINKNDSVNGLVELFNREGTKKKLSTMVK